MTPLRVLVTGGRYYDDATGLRKALDAVLDADGISVLIHGACHLGGADRLAGMWAQENCIWVEEYPVDCTIDGPWPGAGPARNRRMLEASRPDVVLACIGGDGTRNMKSIAKRVGIPVWDVPPKACAKCSGPMWLKGRKWVCESCLAERRRQSAEALQRQRLKEYEEANATVDRDLVDRVAAAICSARVDANPNCCGDGGTWYFSLDDPGRCSGCQDAATKACYGDG